MLTKRKIYFPTNRLILLPCILILIFSVTAFSQRRDTIPVLRQRVDVRKDVPNVIVKDTVPVRPGVITPGNIGIRTKYPDSLIIGNYTIVVESYDKGGEWNNNAIRYEHLNGIGRIKFNCPGLYIVAPGLWRDAVMKTVKYKVVSNQAQQENEITVRDAAELGIQAEPGTEVELVMPHYRDRVVDMSRYIRDLKLAPKPEGMRVRFSDLTVKVSKAGATSGVVQAGVATYPTTPAIPPVPFTLNISPGFQLSVSAVTFSPGLDPLVNAKLILPSSITQNSECLSGRLDLGEFRITPSCEFYKVYAGSDYGIFGVGNTTLGIGGRGYVVDFSSTQAYPMSGKPATWKGVILMQGESLGSPGGTVVSNIGYMQAHYTFSNGLIESSGLTANLQNTGPYAFNAAQPYGYSIQFVNASVNVVASKVSGGSLLEGRVYLPKTAVRQSDDSEVVLTDLNLSIKSDMDLSGFALVKPEVNVYWGDLIAAGGGNRKSFGVENMARQAHLFFSAKPRPAFNPTNFSGKQFSVSFNSLNPAVLDSFNIQGATLSQFSILVINSPNVPMPPSWDPDNPIRPANNSPVWFRLNQKDFCWMNIVTEGIHCSIAGDIMESPPLKLGDPSKPLYVGVTPFNTLTTMPTTALLAYKPISSIVLQCVESAVINCDFRSFLNMPNPVNTILAFKEMVFSSTANNAGGKVVIGANDSLSYWGLKIEPKPGFSSAGLVSVKTGQIVLSAAGLSEKRHFAQPFWLTWGEMLANGTMGRLFFDYNSAGQQFDQFNYVHNAVALSPVNTDPTKKGFLRVGGHAFFPFFGANYLHIIDQYDTTKFDAPYNKRVITLSNSTLGAFLPSDLTVAGNWSDGLGVFNFNIQYADVTQDGFLGTGTSALRYLIGGALGSTLDMNSRGTCIRIGTNLMDQRSIALGPVANISNITRIWGCLCVKGNSFENMVVGGELTTAANMTIAARVGSYLSAILQMSPSLVRLTVDGEAYMSIAASLDALVSGHMQLTLNHAVGFLEGEVQGKFRVAQGSPILVGSSLEAEGQLNWHLGLDFNELQGMVKLKVMSFGGGSAVGAAFYIGENAPKSRAWVLVGGDPRFSLNMTPLPTNLTGIYGSVHVAQGVNMFLISGGYSVDVGLGAFVLPAPIPGALAVGAGLPYVVGNFGGRIYGEILGGLVSAAAYFNLQLIGPYPFSFQGTVGLEACVLWVACGSVDLTVGLNTTEGFYIR